LQHCSRTFIGPERFFSHSGINEEIAGHQEMLFDELQRQVDLDDAGKLLHLLWIIVGSPRREAADRQHFAIRCSK